MSLYKSKNNSGTVNPVQMRSSIVDFTPTAMVEGLFSKKDQAAAMTEGWFIGLDSETGIYDVLDNLTLTFSTPAEARAFVEKRADDGSDLHERALAAMVALTIRSAGRTK